MRLSEHATALIGLVMTSLAAVIAAWRLVAIIHDIRLIGRWRNTIGESEPLDNNFYGDMDGIKPAISPNNAEDHGFFLNNSVLKGKVYFHGLIFLSLAVEVPVYVYHYLISDDKYVNFNMGKNLYALHLTSYFFLVSSFCVIIMLWSNVAVFEPSFWLRMTTRMLKSICFLYFFITALAVGRCIFEKKSSDNFFESVSFAVFCSFSIGVLLILAACFLVVGCLMQQRVCWALGAGLRNSDDLSVADMRYNEEINREKQFTSSVIRINTIVITCFVCFVARALLLVELLQYEPLGKRFTEWVHWQNELHIEWIPNIIPCLALLFLMRGNVIREGQKLISRSIEYIDDSEYTELYHSSLQNS